MDSGLYKAKKGEGSACIHEATSHCLVAYDSFYSDKGVGYSDKGDASE